jgi:hypothetical protein
MAEKAERPVQAERTAKPSPFPPAGNSSTEANRPPEEARRVREEVDRLDLGNRSD